MKIKDLSLPFLGFLQATGLLLYITIVAIIMINAQAVFGKIGPGNFFGPMAFLLLFVVSAIISSTLVLGRSGLLFWNKRYKEALILFLWTLAWIIYFLIEIFVILYIFR